jgi:hypothetical protein
MSGRYRTVALQAVGVAVLAAFVFVAFLRPSEPSDLSGIEAPGADDGPAVVKADPDDGDKNGHKGAHKNGDAQGPGGNRGQDGPRADGNEGRGGPGGPGDGGTVTPPDGDGPDDDQYTDVATVLMQKVGIPNIFREIDDP